MPKRIRRAQVESSLDQNSYRDVDENYALVDVCVSSGCFVYGDEIDFDSKSIEPAARGLEVSEKAIRFDRLSRRASVLDNHRADGSIHDVVGSVEKAWITDDADIPELMATLRISKVSQKEKELAQKIKSKIVNSVSVGADIYDVIDITEAEDDIKRTLAVDWEPVEVSLVPIPADSRAVICSLDNKTRIKYSRRINKSSGDRKMRRQRLRRSELPKELLDAVQSVVGEEKMNEGLEGEILKVLNKAKDYEENAEDSDETMSSEEKEEMAAEEKESMARSAEKELLSAVIDEEMLSEVVDKEKLSGLLDKELLSEAIDKEKLSEAIDKEMLSEIIDKEKLSELVDKETKSEHPEKTAADGSDKEEMSEEEKKTEMKRHLAKALKLLKSQRSYKHGYEDYPKVKSNRSLRSSISVGENYKSSYIKRSRDQISEAICERIGAPGIKTKKSNDFRGMSMHQMFKELLYREGNYEARNWSPELVYDTMVTKRITRSTGGPFAVTSDLANIFSTSVNKAVQQSYEYMRGVQTFDPFVKRVTVKDFQTQEEVSLGEFGKLQETPPGAESPVTPISDHKETWRVKSYTNIFRITRQGFINDNTGELENVLTSGASAADLESDLVYAELNSGTVDGRPWARTGNNNLTSGAPLGAEDDPYKGLKAIYEGLARQTGLDVDTPLNLTFKYLIVPVTLYYAAAQSQGTLNGVVIPNKTGDLNPYASMYKIVKEPRLDNYSTSTYYGIAGEANLFRKFLVLGTLSKGGNPNIKFQETFGNDVLSWKLTHDVGAKVLDYRMAHKVTA